MSICFKKLPGVQELISECDEDLLVREIMRFYQRKTERMCGVVLRAIREMRELDCGREVVCEREIDYDGDCCCAIVVPRQRFLAQSADVYIRRVCAEYLDVLQSRVLSSAVCGRTWQEVLSYRVWDVESISIMDLHSLIADVCFGMLKCGVTSREALICANMSQTAQSSPPMSAGLAQKTQMGSNMSASLMQEAQIGLNMNTDSNRKGTQIVYVKGMCALEQLAISLGWLKVLNKRADEIFVAEASRLQKFAS